MLYTAKTLVDYGSIHTYAVLHYAGTVVTVLHSFKFINLLVVM